jgi:hypothetical protein
MSPHIQPQNLQGLPCGAAIDGHADTCPVCHNGIRPIYLGVDSINERKFVERLLRCPREECQRLFIAYYQYSDFSDIYLFKLCLPVEPEEVEFSDVVREISPDYCSIYNDAHKAEQRGYSQVCGPGYRKALEFLVKDFLSRDKTPEQKDEIEKLPLVACVKKYVNDARLKAVAERAAWLGNDETHYVRKWEDKDLEDLKKFIQLTEYWIESEHLTRESIAEMPEGKKSGG